MRPGAQPRLCVPAMRSSDLHQPLGSEDRRWSRRSRADSGQIRLSEHGTGKSVPLKSTFPSFVLVLCLFASVSRRTRRSNARSSNRILEASFGCSDFVAFQFPVLGRKKSHSETYSQHGWHNRCLLGAAHRHVCCPRLGSRAPIRGGGGLRVLLGLWCGDAPLPVGREFQD